MSESSQKFLDVAVPIVASCALTLLVLAPIGYIAWRNLPKAVATVDLQKLVDEEQQRTIAILSKNNGVISDEQRDMVQKLTVNFAKKLSASMDTLGEECRCVIVNKAALLGGSSIDYTDLVRERMK